MKNRTHDGLAAKGLLKDLSRKTNYKEKLFVTCVILLTDTHLFHSEDKLIKKEL